MRLFQHTGYGTAWRLHGRCDQDGYALRKADSKDCRCKDRDKVNDGRSVNATMQLYDGAKPESQRQWKQSTKRRVWEEAEQVRREWLDSFDPTKIELKRLRLEEESPTASPLTECTLRVFEKAECGLRRDRRLRPPGSCRMFGVGSFIHSGGRASEGCSGVNSTHAE
jgi:hypothetical protein